MKILLVAHLNSDFFQSRSSLVNYFLGNNFIVNVLLPSNDIFSYKKEYDSLKRAGVIFHYYKYSRKSFPFFNTISNVYNICKSINKCKIDLVFTIKFYPNFLNGVLFFFNRNILKAGMIAGRGRFINSHNFYSPINLIFKLYIKLLKNFNIIFVQNHADFVFFKTKLTGVKVVLISGSGLNTDSVYSEYNLNKMLHKQNLSEEFNINFDGKKFWFLFSSRIIEDKGIIELIDAFRSTKISSNAGLLISGWFDNEKIKSNILSKIESSKNIFYLKNFKDFSIPFSVADCIVLPSRYGEGVPRSLIEALSFEKSIITSNYPGCIDCFENNGFVINYVDYLNILDAVNKFCSLDKDQINLFQKNSYSLYKNKFHSDIVYSLIANELKLITTSSE